MLYLYASPGETARAICPRFAGESLAESGLDPRHFILCTDDSHSETLVKDGHMDRVLRHAVEQGVDPLVAIQMATINTAEHFRVDREMGITLVAFKQMKTIVLGYHNYKLKFNMLKDILSNRRRRSFPEFDRIDLNNVNRIVVNPVNKIPTGDHKEV